MGRAPCKIDRIPFCGGEMGVRGKGFFELDLHVTRKKRSGKPEILDLQSREMGGDSRLLAAPTKVSLENHEKFDSASLSRPSAI